MKRKFVLLTTLLAFIFMGYGQNTLNENFDSDTTSLPSNWTFILDGTQEDENELEVDLWVEEPGDNSYWSGRTLSNPASVWILFQYCMDPNAKIYMISPKLKVTSANNSFKFNLFVDNFVPEEGKFSVLVSTSSNAKEDFNTTPLLQVETADLFAGWDEYEIDLSSYNGQEIYVAIVFSDPEAYTWFFVDNVTGPELVEENDNDDCTIKSLPFSENFDTWDWAEVSDCWTMIDYDFFQGMRYPTTLVNGYNHTNWLAFMDIGENHPMVASLPRLADNINVNTLHITFDASNYYANGKLIVGVMDDPDSINTFVAVDTLMIPERQQGGQEWFPFDVDFSEYTGSGKYISLQAGYPYNTGNVMIGVENLILDYMSNPNVTYDTVTETMCQGQSFTFNGEELTENGVYFDTINVTADSIAEIQVLILTVNPTYNQNINDTIFEGETYTQNGFNETQSGQYTLTLQTENGCDSIVVLNLVVLPTPCENVTTALEESICEGESFEFNNTIYTEQGVYQANLQTWDGCDSTVTLTLNVYPSFTETIDATITEGETYTQNGFNENQSGQYTLTLQTINGCDSIIVLNLTVEPISSIKEVASEINFTIYPNPAKEKLFVKTTEQNANIVITNISGVVVYQNNNHSSTLIEINLTDFENGIYFVRINNLEAKKFIIEK